MEGGWRVDGGWVEGGWRVDGGGGGGGWRGEGRVGGGVGERKSHMQTHGRHARRNDLSKHIVGDVRAVRGNPADWRNDVPSLQLLLEQLQLAHLRKVAPPLRLARS